MQDTPLEATHWGRWARQLPLSSAVPLLVTPPVVGGLLVGALRAASSFDDPTAAGSAPGAAPNDAALRDGTASASASGRGGRQHSTRRVPPVVGTAEGTLLPLLLYATHPPQKLAWGV